MKPQHYDTTPVSTTPVGNTGVDCTSSNSQPLNGAENQAFGELGKDMVNYTRYRDQSLNAYRGQGFGASRKSDGGQVVEDSKNSDGGQAPGASQNPAAKVAFFAYTIPASDESLRSFLADLLGCDSDRLGECKGISLISLPQPSKEKRSMIYVRLLPGWSPKGFLSPESICSITKQIESAGGSYFGFFETSLSEYKRGYIPGAIRFDDYQDVMVSVEAKIDWFNGSYPIEKLPEVMRLGAKYLGGEFCYDDSRPNLKHYRKAYWNPLGVVIGTNHYSDPSHGYLEVRGGILSYISPSNLHKFFSCVKALGFVCSRIDVCLDIFGFPHLLQYAIDAGNARHYAGYRNSFRVIQSGAHASKGLTAAWGNRGSAGSGKQTEIYDKYLESRGERKCIRIEVSFSNASSPRSGSLKGCYAHNAFLSFCDNPVDGTDDKLSWGSMIRSYVIGTIDFVDRSTPSGRLNQPCRSKRYDWWEKICNSAEPKVLPPKDVSISVRRTIAWLRKIAPSISMVKTVFESISGRQTWDKLINKILYDGNQRMAPKHYIAANQSIAQVNQLLQDATEKDATKILNALSVGDLLKDEIQSEDLLKERRERTNRCLQFLDKLFDLAESSEPFFWSDVYSEYLEIEVLSEGADLPDNYWEYVTEFIGNFAEYVDEQTGICLYSNQSSKPMPDNQDSKAIASDELVQEFNESVEIPAITGERYRYIGESRFFHVMDALGKWVKAWFEFGLELEAIDQISSNDSYKYVRPVGQGLLAGFRIYVGDLELLAI